MNDRGTRLTSSAVRRLLSVIRHMRVLGGVPLGRIVTDNAVPLLNLPGELPFFPTAVTDRDAVQSLIRKLHPIAGGHALIRLGAAGDGGYLVPDDLDGIDACFSPGVSTVADFELDCAVRGMNIFMADASVDAPPIDHPRFHFQRTFIGGQTEGDYVTLADWVCASAGHTNGDLLLQMDIEGAEYETLLAAPSILLQRFRIIVIEFHFLDRLFCGPLFPLYRRVFEKLLATHCCVHIHPNNCCGTINVRGLEALQMGEFTFLRRNRVTDNRFRMDFPHPLDRDNLPGPTVVLPRSFFHAS